jgi:hypothetical protein
MKRIILIFGVLSAMTGIVTAYVGRGCPPIRSLPEAYGLAAHSLGSLTNQLRCIEAKRDKDIRQWDFIFEGTLFGGTNVTHKYVIVEDDLTDSPARVQDDVK